MGCGGNNEKILSCYGGMYLWIHTYMHIYTYVFMYTYILSLDMCVMCTFIYIYIYSYIMSHCYHVACSISLKNSYFISLMRIWWMVWKNIYVSKCVSGRHLGSWLYSISDLGCVRFIFHWGLPFGFVHISVWYTLINTF